MKKMGVIANFTILIIISILIAICILTAIFIANTSSLSSRLIELSDILLTSDITERNLKDEKLNDKYGEDITDYIAKIAEDPLWNLDLEIVRSYTVKLQQLPNIYYAVIYDNENNIIAGGKKEGKNIKIYRKDIIVKNEKIGSLEIAIDKAYLNTLFEENIKNKARLSNSLQKASQSIISEQFLIIILASVLLSLIIIFIVYQEYRISEKSIKNANRELKESEEKFRNIFEQAAVGIVYSALDGTFLRVNKKFLDIIQYNPSEIYKIKFQDITHPDDISMDLENIKLVLNNNINDYSLEKRYIRKDGSTIWVKLTVSVVRSEDGTPRHFVAVIEDINQKKMIEKTLQEKDRVIKDIQEGISSTIGEKFFETIVIKLAQLLQADYTYIAKIIIAQNSIKTISMCADGRIDENIEYRLKDTPCADIISDKICSYKRNVAEAYPKDILLKQMGVSGYVGTPLFDANHNTIGIMVALYKKEIEDPSFAETVLQIFSSRAGAEIERINKEEEMKRLNEKYLKEKEKAEEANKAKSMFLANMSHELRTPLNGIVGLVEILNMTELTDQQKMFLKDIDSCSTNLLAIINDILDIAKIEAGKIEVETHEFEFEKLIETISNSFSLDFFKKGLEFGYYVAPDIPKFVEGDEAKIRQIITNLINNSKKFTDKGHVYVEVLKTFEQNNQCQLQFMVSDTGIGISESIKNRLFMPFEQGDISYSKKYQGTGLGLSIAKRLVELMGGNIWFESEEGKGSKFFFNVNLRRSEKLHREIKSSKLDLNDIKVFVIDDNELNRFITSKMLKEYNIETVLAESGSKAFETLEKEKDFSLLLLDVNMPEMDGLQVAQKLKELNNKIPVILFTSVDITNKSELITTLDIKDTIVKPVKKQELIDKIVGALHIKVLEETEIQLINKPEKSFQNTFRILVAEDNDISMKNIKFFLENAGYEVYGAINGKEAVDIYEKEKPDLILMDLQMPVMNGFEATRLIRDNNSDIPIIALTAYARKEDEEKCVAAGMNDFISKPARSTVILEKIKTILQ